MGLWLVRAGKHGQAEQDFLDDERIYLWWGGLQNDLSEFKTRAAIRKLIAQQYPEWNKAKISNATGQIWGFVHGIQPGDWVALPSKNKPAIHFGVVKGPYVFEPQQPDQRRQYREIEWFATDIPRSIIDQDILYSLGAFMTVCRIKRNRAEERIRSLAANNWSPLTRSIAPANAPADDEEEAAEETPDLETLGRDQIAKLIQARFKGHGMARLVEAILKSQGYTTYLSPPGPDRGIDILAAPAPMGFGSPRICVQVKSGDSPLDRPTLDQLIGAMQNVNADQGLLVSWGGFKSTVDREKPNQFFRVRLWDQSDLIEHLLDRYDALDADLRAELPFKRIWTVAASDDPVLDEAENHGSD